MEKIKKDIVVVGAGLTGLTTAFHLIRKGLKVQVVERNSHVGGQIRTYRENGFVFESGPNTGVISYPEVAELFTALAPDCELEIAKEDAKRRLIWKGDRFHELPSGLISAVKTPLFSLTDKFRILLEPFRPKGIDPDESVASLACRRLGKSFLDYAVDPFLSGVYAGDPHTLITRYALPKLYNLEQNYGSFIKGAIAKSKLPKTERDKLATKQVFSARNGLDNLPKALAKHIGENNITLEAGGVTIQPGVDGQTWLTSFSNSQKIYCIESNYVVTTAGGYCLPDLLPFIDTFSLHTISSLRYVPVIQASVGIDNTKGREFNAFGGLVPSREKKDILGILFPSACFIERAPVTGALFSFFIGGSRRPDLFDLPDFKLEGLISRNLHQMLRLPLSIEPTYIHIFRHKKAIPQYEKSSGLRFETIHNLEKKYPGLILAGNIQGGIGMADRIRQGTEVARSITATYR